MSHLLLLAETFPEIPSYITWAMPLLLIGVLVQFFWSSLITWLIYTLSKRDRREEVTDERLHEMAAKLIDERLRASSHEFKNHANNLMLVMDEVKSKLRDREEEFRDLSDEDHQVELKLNNAIAQMREISATKEDLRQHEIGVNQKFDRADARMQNIELSTHRIELEAIKAMGELKDCVATKDDLMRMRAEINRG
jgi:hypothetical protein